MEHQNNEDPLDTVERNIKTRKSVMNSWDDPK